MTFDEYQRETGKTAVYPKLMHGSVYPALGLAGEAGEVAEKVKKLVRDDEGKVSDDKLNDVKKELGDVLWYVSQIATEFSLNLDEIAEANISKLKDRAKRGKIKGSGDNR
jgi:NTP pyrophosphatase (non-canonical NTP hydrolase)